VSPNKVAKNMHDLNTQFERYDIVLIHVGHFFSQYFLPLGK